MEIKNKEYILYGLEKHKEIIDNIIIELNANSCDFDIRLILTEALTNAFNHGNKKDIKKPINLRYTYDGANIKFIIEDCGKGLKDIAIPDCTSDENLFKDSGRGFFLMNSLADKLEISDNALIIQKKIFAQ